MANKIIDLCLNDTDFLIEFFYDLSPDDISEIKRSMLNRAHSEYMAKMIKLAAERFVVQATEELVRGRH